MINTSHKGRKTSRTQNFSCLDEALIQILNQLIFANIGKAMIPIFMATLYK